MNLKNVGSLNSRAVFNIAQIQYFCKFIKLSYLDQDKMFPNGDFVEVYTSKFILQYHSHRLSKITRLPLGSQSNSIHPPVPLIKALPQVSQLIRAFIIIHTQKCWRMLQRDYYKGLSERERLCGAILKSELGSKQKEREKRKQVNVEFSHTKKSHPWLNCQFMEISWRFCSPHSG